MGICEFDFNILFKLIKDILGRDKIHYGYKYIEGIFK